MVAGKQIDEIEIRGMGQRLAAKPPQDKGNRGGKPDNEAQERKEDREDLRDLEAGIDLVSGLISLSRPRKLVA